MRHNFNPPRQGHGLILEAAKVAPGQSGKGINGATYYVVSPAQKAWAGAQERDQAESEPLCRQNTPFIKEPRRGSNLKKIHPPIRDRRSSLRRRTRLRSGKIVDPGSRFLIDCQIYDRSDGGARLRLLASASVPAKIQLFEALPESLTDATVVWRREREIGICFEPPARPRKLSKTELMLLRGGYNPARRYPADRA
jgi:hypothetical protein